MDSAALLKHVFGFSLVLYGLGLLWFRWGAPRSKARRYFLVRWRFSGRHSRSVFSLLVQASLYVSLGTTMIASQCAEIDRSYFAAGLLVFGVLLWIARINDLRPEDL